MLAESIFLATSLLLTQFYGLSPLYTLFFNKTRWL